MTDSIIRGVGFAQKAQRNQGRYPRDAHPKFIESLLMVMADLRRVIASGEAARKTANYSPSSAAYVPAMWSTSSECRYHWLVRLALA